MDCIIENYVLESDGVSTYIYIKGWVHFNNYKIVVMSKDKELFSVNGNNCRYDICKYYGEDICDNTYGFEIEKQIDFCLKKVKIYLEYDNCKVLLKKIDNRKFFKVFNKIKKIFNLFIKAIKFLWREYHFIVPLTMIKKYFKDLKNKIIHISKNEKCYYNPDIPLEYSKWIKKNENSSLEKEFKNITFLILRTGEEVPGFYEMLGNKDYIIIDENIYINIKNIKTEYIGIISDNCLIDKKLDSFLYDIRGHDFIYFDSDCCSEDKKRFSPFFKPDWSKDTILGVNYIGNFIIVNKKLLKKIDFMTKNIYNYILDIRNYILKPLHIPSILFHNFNYCTEQDNVFNIVSKYIKKEKIDANVVLNNDKETVSLLYNVKNNPLISIIIPTKDHVDILKKCIDSIYKKTTYSNFEVILIDNNSEKKESFEFFNDCKNKYSNFYVHRLECPFNYSYINNFAIKEYSKGEYILLLNNDTEVITNDWLQIMLGYASQKDIGTVGVKLNFQDDTIQHAGIIMGKGGLAGHARYGYERFKLSSQWELKVPYNVSGCTAACLMIKKSKFFEVGGLEEKLQVAFNDVDFNLKVLSAGYRNVFLPNVELYHYESKSRGLDTTPEKQKRFMQEWQFMDDKWNKKVKSDPFYNCNFSLVYDYMLEDKEF